MTRSGWLDPGELRIGLGCMRLSTDAGRDDDVAVATITAADDAGITVFDTAHAYGRGADDLGHSERLLARALHRTEGATSRARIVTKGGMARTDARWVPDGRARAILADCEASLVALDGLAIDLYLIHAPDPRTPWTTSLRALARLHDEGLVRHVGASNINRQQLDMALDLVPLTAVQVAINPFDDSAFRGGVLTRCREAGIAVIAHSPLGGPRRRPALTHQPVLTDVARACGASAAEVALAWLLDLSPEMVAIPGATRPETARSAARAATLALDTDQRAALARTFGSLKPPQPARAARSDHDDGEVVVVMGVPGAGKGRVAAEHTTRGYRRLNRDERGGSLRDLAAALDQALSDESGRVVLDNTYLTRASRSHVLDVAGRHGVPVRCLWLDTPLAQAQANMVERLLDHLGDLPTPEQLREAARGRPGLLTPTQQMRTFRELEPPSADEGFASIERVEFTRITTPLRTRPGVFLAAAALTQSGTDSPFPDAPHLVFDWRPDGSADDLAPLVARIGAAVDGPVEGAVCPHGAGPPRCWCRPPLPGLPLAFARRHRVDPARSVLIGTSAAHRTLATTLAARYVAADPPLAD